jgi:hypothetical protein
MSGIDIANRIASDPSGTHLVWSEGMSDWADARSRKDIASLPPGARSMQNCSDCEAVASSCGREAQRKIPPVSFFVAFGILMVIAILLHFIVSYVNRNMVQPRRNVSRYEMNLPSSIRTSKPINTPGSFARLSSRGVFFTGVPG